MPPPTKKGNAMTIEMVLSSRERELIKAALVIAAEHKLRAWTEKNGMDYDFNRDELKIAEFYRIADWITISEMCARTSKMNLAAKDIARKILDDSRLCSD